VEEGEGVSTIFVTPKTGPSVNRHRSKQDYETPEDFMQAVIMRFGTPSFDLAAHIGNTKASDWFCEKENSLARVWSILTGTLWLNPPFADILPWVKKCEQEAAKGARILALLPSSTDSNWWADHVHGKCGVLFLNPRIKFVGHKQGYPRPLALCCYNLLPAGSYAPWRWKP
jgi:phage N-6-adenine-methyltransferase